MYQKKVIKILKSSNAKTLYVLGSNLRHQGCSNKDKWGHGVTIASEQGSQTAVGRLFVANQNPVGGQDYCLDGHGRLFHPVYHGHLLVCYHHQTPHYDHKEVVHTEERVLEEDHVPLEAYLGAKGLEAERLAVLGQCNMQDILDSAKVVVPVPPYQEALAGVAALV